MPISSEVIKNLFKKPITINYPKEKVNLSQNFRGMLYVEKEKCISCGLCKMVCPTNAVTLALKIKEIKGDGIIYKKTVHDIKSIDMGKCVSCGLCVDICPVKIIQFTNQFDGVTNSRKKLVK
jgi:formate hydrogenlyase subunit 6/NADH:ubiquinone oxidoreductase subunit I